MNSIIVQQATENNKHTPKGLRRSCSYMYIARNPAWVQATSDMLAAQQHFLPLLHQLEAVSSGSIIGPLAETLLEELQQSGSSGVGQAISQLRTATKAAMKAKAMARRKAMLASLNMPSSVYHLCWLRGPPPPRPFPTPPPRFLLI